jgi:hypothetical protein
VLERVERRRIGRARRGALDRHVDAVEATPPHLHGTTRVDPP